MRGGRPGWGAHLWMVGWHPWAMKRLVTKYNDVDHGVDRLARILVPRGASIVMCALGGWCACGVECGGAIVLILRGGWAKRAELGAEIAPRTEAEIEPRIA